MASRSNIYLFLVVTKDFGEVLGLSHLSFFFQAPPPSSLGHSTSTRELTAISTRTADCRVLFIKVEKVETGRLGYFSCQGATLSLLLPVISSLENVVVLAYTPAYQRSTHADNIH